MHRLGTESRGVAAGRARELELPKLPKELQRGGVIGPVTTGAVAVFQAAITAVGLYIISSRAYAIGSVITLVGLSTIFKIRSLSGQLSKVKELGYQFFCDNRILRSQQRWEMGSNYSEEDRGGQAGAVAYSQWGAGTIEEEEKEGFHEDEGRAVAADIPGVRLRVSDTRVQRGLGAGAGAGSAYLEDAVLERANQRAEAAEQRVAELEEEIAKLKRNQLDESITSALDGAVSTAEEDLAGLREELKEARGQLKEAQSEVARLRSELENSVPKREKEALQEELAVATRQLESQGEELTGIRGQLQKAEEDKAALQASLRHVTEQLAQAKIDIQTALEQKTAGEASRIKETDRANKKRIDELSGENEKLSEENKKLLRENSILKGIVAQLRVQPGESDSRSASNGAAASKPSYAAAAATPPRSTGAPISEGASAAADATSSGEAK